MPIAIFVGGSVLANVTELDLALVAEGEPRLSFGVRAAHLIVPSRAEITRSTRTSTRSDPRAAPTPH